MVLAQHSTLIQVATYINNYYRISGNFYCMKTCTKTKTLKKFPSIVYFRILNCQIYYSKSHVFYVLELIKASVILPEMEEKIKKMCIRGIHVYKDVWDAIIGNELQCGREE